MVINLIVEGLYSHYWDSLFQSFVGAEFQMSWRSKPLADIPLESWLVNRDSLSLVYETVPI